MAPADLGAIDRAIEKLDRAQALCRELLDMMGPAPLSLWPVAPAIAAAFPEASMPETDNQTERPDDNAALAAAVAASGVSAVTSQGNADVWPIEDQDAPALPKFATFVRENPSAPAEALFGFARGQELVREDAPAWSDLPIGERLAFEVFHDTLLRVDRALGAGAPTPAGMPYRPSLNPEDTILETHRGLNAKSDQLLEELDRPMQIVPGTGKLPNETVLRGRGIGIENAKPKPIEENLVKLGEVDSAAPHLVGPDGSDRRGHDGAPVPTQPDPIAGAPRFGVGLAPGGAVGQAEGIAALGHGFDPDAGNPAGPAGLPADLQPRNDPALRAGETQGTPPAEPRSPQNANVEAPGEGGGNVSLAAMQGAGDELGVRNAPMLGATLEAAGVTAEEAGLGPDEVSIPGAPPAEPLSPQNLNVPTAGNTQPAADALEADQVHRNQAIDGEERQVDGTGTSETGEAAPAGAASVAPPAGEAESAAAGDVHDDAGARDHVAGDTSGGADAGEGRGPAPVPARDPLADGDDPIDPVKPPKSKKKK